MTLVRGLALKISNTVVRYASPGCKEWAEGLAQEVSFVESDWAALGWALGSIRILLDYREALPKSAEDLIAAAQKFADLKHQRNGEWKFWLAWSAIYFGRFFRATSLLQRTGCVLALAGYLGLIALLRWRRRLQVPLGEDSVALIRFYKAELERFRDFCDSPKLWLAGLAFTSFCVGVILSEFSKLGGFRAYVIFSAGIVLIWMIGVLVFLWVQRINQRRLERVEALLAERPDVR